MYPSLPQQPPTPGLLAIDTSTDQAGIALVTPGGIVTHSWPAARAHTTTVLPEIDRLVREHGMVPADITGIAVATGPGTFTGLRVGVAITKGIVAASQVPLVGIPTLDIVFARHPGEDIVAVLPAGRGRVVWQQAGEAPGNSTIAELVDVLRGMTGTPLVGELSTDQLEALQSAGIHVVPEFRDPAVLLYLGAARIAAGGLDDPVSLEPTYLHGVTVSAPPIEDRHRKA
jgi:tRNA threonylcarbamoyladenosine biosynthesis protein TsaB